MAKERRRSSAVSIGNWMWTMVLNVLFPVVFSGIIVFISTKFELTELMYAAPFGPLVFYILVACCTHKASKRNWAIANIIWMLIAIALVACVVIFFGDAILAALNELLNMPVTSLLN